MSYWGESVKGVEKFKERLSSDRDIFSNLHYTVVDTIAESGKVAAAWIVEGTHDKEFRGVPATHKKFETVGISIFHFEGAKIKNAWAAADALTPAIELGVVKTTSSEASAES
jgi:steroid delta-isomerase-like uncharacterized protein